MYKRQASSEKWKGISNGANRNNSCLRAARIHLMKNSKTQQPSGRRDEMAPSPRYPLQSLENNPTSKMTGQHQKKKHFVYDFERGFSSPLLRNHEYADIMIEPFNEGLCLYYGTIELPCNWILLRELQNKYKILTTTKTYLHWPTSPSSKNASHENVIALPVPPTDGPLCNLKALSAS